jgi:hypothetical protein
LKKKLFKIAIGIWKNFTFPTPTQSKRKVVPI